jgi:hypothetical protein
MKQSYKFIEQGIRIRITPTSMGKGASIGPRNARMIPALTPCESRFIPCWESGIFDAPKGTQ